jgi:hypothetical protein
MQTPTAEWKLDELANYAIKMLNAYREGPVRMAIDVFRFGHALSLAKAKLKQRKEWVEWQSKHDLPRPTVNQAIRLYQHFGEESALEGKTIMVAKREAGIIKPQAVPKPPVYVAADSPKPVLRLERTIHAVDDALQGVKEELETLDRDDLVKLARELEKLARDAARLAKPSKSGKVAVASAP